MAKTDDHDEGFAVASPDSSWVFTDREASIDEVKALLASVKVPYSEVPATETSPPLDPVTMDRYLPYVLPMSNRQKVKVADPRNPQRTIDQYVLQTTLYTQVAGRLAILADVAERNRWTVSVFPEPNTPTEIPGYLRFDDRLVFRVYVRIHDADGELLGSRFGTAWAKSEGGFNAEGSNPYETVETSALGRALAQWGFGILPGSGIASVEEMRLAQRNQGRPSPSNERRPERVKEDRGDLVASAIEFIDKRRKMTGISQQEGDASLETWVRDKFSINGFVNESGGYEWTLLTDAQIALLRNSMRDSVVAAAAAGEGSV